jgi:multidrug efflux pump subunit AcrA (membrane-fusion protein)
MKKVFIFLLVLIVIFGVLFVTFGDKLLHREGPVSGLWHCPMHPDYISDKPGSCPICGMDLVPIPADHPHSNAKVSDKPVVPPLRQIKLTENQEQLIGVKTAVAGIKMLKQTIDATAVITHDPELYAALMEYKQTLGTEFEQAASLKLHHMGLSHAQIKSYLKYSNTQLKNLLFSHQQNQKLWLYAQIYEQDVSLVKPGQRMIVQSESAPGIIFPGRVESLDQKIDPDTRTLRVRAVVQNIDNLLLPEMYVQAQILVPMTKKLAVPKEAVLDTGLQKIVFVKIGPGLYEPHEVVTGILAGEDYEIKKGLKAGTVVAVSGVFLLDSESKMKAVKVVNSHD